MCRLPLVSGLMLLLVSWAMAQLQVAQPTVTVDAAKLSASFREAVPNVTVPITNSHAESVPARVVLQWLDDKEDLLGESSITTDLPPGASTLQLRVPGEKLTLWTRLRYRLTRIDTQQPLAYGHHAISELSPDIFELKVGVIGAMRAGTPASVYAQAIHPRTRQRVSGLQWIAELDFAGTKFPAQRIEEQPGGIVRIDFDLPANPTVDSLVNNAGLTVSAQCGAYMQTADEWIVALTHLSAQIQTDKPIYQPGQTVHFRALIRNPKDTAAPDAKLQLRIEDEGHTRFHTIDLRSSAFGIVHDDWQIPESTEPGNYTLVLYAEGDHDYQIGSHSVRVSRYTLPTFKVEATPETRVLLPGTPARVTVATNYLYGRPVPNAKVSIVREDNYDRYHPPDEDPEDLDVVSEGAADATGHYRATLDVTEDFAELRAMPTSQFADLHYAAYVEDPSTGRTEQSRFDLRITLHPVHLYVIAGETVVGLPAPIYVTASNADGTPATATELHLTWAGGERIVRTNRYGVAKAELPGHERVLDSLRVEARDAEGRVSPWLRKWLHSPQAPLRLSAQRTLLPAGASVPLQLTLPPSVSTTSPGRTVVIQALRGDIPVATQLHRLKAKQSSISFPSHPEFRGIISFVAWEASSIAPNRYQNFGIASVVFPNPGNLTVTARPLRKSYQPGEQAGLRIQVASTVGKGEKAVLGLAVVDESVHQRAATDADFGQRCWFQCIYCYFAQQSEIAGISLNDLDSLSSAAVASPDLALVAEALLTTQHTITMELSDETLSDPHTFRSVSTQMHNLGGMIESFYARTLDFPRSQEDLHRNFSAFWQSARDPWDSPYQASFDIEGDSYVLRLDTAGPDRRMGTEDDFEAGSFRKSYFFPTERLIEEALRAQDDFPITQAGFEAILRSKGLLFSALRDPWGSPYTAEFRAYGDQQRIEIRSAGPDGIAETEDDATVATFTGRLFTKQSARIRAALDRASSPPTTVEAFLEILGNAQIPFATFMDSWQSPYRLTLSVASQFADSARRRTVQTFGQSAVTRTDIVPVTRRVAYFLVQSNGPDRIPGTIDDFIAARFPVVLSEESPGNPSDLVGSPIPTGTGQILGHVTDQTGAMIPGASLRVTLLDGSSAATTTEADGFFYFPGLPAGSYTLRTSANGFATYELASIPVNDGKATEVTIELQVGMVTEVNEVTAEAAQLETATAQVAISSSGAGPVSTPRLRSHFPETLLWIPALETNDKGEATVTVPLGDSVTTWKVALFASTKDGRANETETDIVAFQPFFLDFDPPAVLTQGDIIDEPVTIRNYQSRDEQVALDVAVPDWAEIADRPSASIGVPAGASANATFRLRAAKPTASGLQRITARAGKTGDAIERPTAVMPDGKEVRTAIGGFSGQGSSLDLDIPASTIPGTATAELRIYPNFDALLLEGVSAILAMPHGCAEQTTSAGYANLIALRFLRQMGSADSPTATKALRKVADAAIALRKLQHSTGGISYWPYSEPDLAVSAYVLQFLSEAAPLLVTDSEFALGIIAYLAKTQRQDGSWSASREDDRREQKALSEAVLTGTILRGLAAARNAGTTVPEATITSALRYLTITTATYNEPQLLATTLLAALDLGRDAEVSDVATQLAALARRERDGLYWDLQVNTPFYGWGHTGRFESTSLVVSALGRWQLANPAQANLEPYIRGGLHFLLRNRAADGSWYSTRATVQAMRATVDSAGILGIQPGNGGSLVIRVNGSRVEEITLPKDRRASDPIFLDLSRHLRPGENQIALVSSNGAASLYARLAATHWLPWSETENGIAEPGELEYSVRFGSAEAAPRQPIRCTVNARRIGFRGYGMLLAEVGLPPGAEVDRASLEAALENAAGFDHYEVRPDRVILYLWPNADGSEVEFEFHTRYPMKAKARPSLLYDYYNPEARIVLEPDTFHIGATRTN